MNIKIIFALFTFIITIATHNVGLAHDHDTTSTSFLLFTLQDNHIQIERYSFDEIKDTPVELSTDICDGHTLYKIKLSKTTNASSLFFYPTDQRYLAILTTQEQKELDLLLSWAPLITQNIKQLSSLETFDFSIEHLENKGSWQTILICQLDSDEKENTLSFLSETPIKAACGAFVCDSCFNYDKGLFSRTFDQKEVETLGLFKKWDTRKTKGLYKQIGNVVMLTASMISHYTAAGLSTGKSAIIKTISYSMATLNRIKNYFKNRKDTNNAQKELHKSFDAEAEFDKLLEETMNIELDFIPEEKPKESPAIIQWGQRFGTYILMRYIDLEQKIKNSLQKISSTE